MFSSAVSVEPQYGHRKAALWSWTSCGGLAPRGLSPPSLVQLQRGSFKCPYCGSTDTRLENIFGPTPCRSLRYCASCRQPFEQFKTI